VKHGDGSGKREEGILTAMDRVWSYCAICAEEMETPVDFVASLAAAPSLVVQALRSAKGSEAGWSPAEVAVHLADTEIVTSWRLRQTLAEEEPEIDSYDQEHWAAALAYRERDPEAALTVFQVLRAANLELLRSLDDAGWARAYHQAEYGRLTIRALAEHKAHHDLTHLHQMRGG
jgi:hypothetical protein